VISLEKLLAFIEEDAPFGDITSETIVEDRDVSAEIVVKDDTVIAGLEEAGALFSYFGIIADPMVRDGSIADKGSRIMKLRGSARKILLVERTALNIIGRMSGIASITRRYADLIHAVNPKCRVAATRKTAPGLRALDKKAVILGGGDPHRFNLSDGILIKDNHLALVPQAKAIAACRSAFAFRRIEIEVESPADALHAAEAGADIIMMDNMDPAGIQTAINLLDKSGLRNKVIIEVSGGIDVHSLQGFARLDIDLISTGALTHSVKNTDVSLEILKEEEKHTGR